MGVHAGNDRLRHEVHSPFELRYALLMSAPEDEPSPSLIQQRMALERPKTLATWTVATCGITAAAWLFGAISGEGGGVAWALGITFTVITVMNAFILRGARPKLRAFEDRFGPDAGRQK